MSRVHAAVGVAPDERELVELALDLCNIRSLPGEEREVAEYVYQWLVEQGFDTRRIGLLEDRYSVLGRLAGSGGGYTLIFNSHFDTDTDLWLHDTARREGDTLLGEGIVNDKGPLAAFLIAAKLLRDSGAELKGDLLVSGVPGEIGVEPVDEFTAPRYLSKEVGTRYLIQHGGVAHFALNAEATDWGYASVEAGKAFFKISVQGGEETYTPLVPALPPSAEHPNAIVRAAELVPKLQEWANEYERRFRYESAGGTIVPKVAIGAIRGGKPYHITRTAPTCALYLDVRLVPNQDPLAIREELSALLERLGLVGSVELFLYRRAHEAGDVAPLLESIGAAHSAVIGGELELAATEVSSMWRDLTVFNELGIPSITYGPPRGDRNRTMEVQDLCRTAQVYAEIAHRVCCVERRPRHARRHGSPSTSSTPAPANDDGGTS